MNVRGPVTTGTDRGSVVAGCVAIGVSIATLGIPANLNGLFAERLHVSGAELTWIGDADFVGAAVSAYLMGSLADRFGRRRILVLGALLVVIGQLISAFGTAAPVLWTGQALAGVGVGGLSAVSLAVVVAAVRDPAGRPRALAAFAASLTAGSVASSLVGAFLAQGMTYTWAFVGMAVIAAAGLLVIVTRCSETRPESPRAFDVAGQLTLAVTLCAVLWAVIEGSATRWDRPAIIVAFVIAVAAAGAFLWIERRPGGMINLAIFADPAFAASGATAFVSFLAFTAGVYLYAIRVSIAQGHSVRFTAMGLVVVGVVAGVTGYASRALLARQAGTRPLIVAGFVSFAAAAVWLAQLPIAARGFAPLLGFLVLMGVGQGATAAGMTAGAVASLGPESESVAASTQGVLRQLGSPIGLALIGAVVFSRSQTTLDGALGGLAIPGAAARTAADVNAHAGVLGVLESGLGERVPAVGQASVAALSSALGFGARVVASVCVVLAVIAAVLLRRRTARANNGR